MHETYRMLGRQHEADLMREARKRDLAAEARPKRAARGQATRRYRQPWRLVLRARLTSFLA